MSTFPIRNTPWQQSPPSEQSVGGRAATAPPPARRLIHGCGARPPCRVGVGQPHVHTVVTLSCPTIVELSTPRIGNAHLCTHSFQLPRQQRSPCGGSTMMGGVAWQRRAPIRRILNSGLQATALRHACSPREVASHEGCLCFAALKREIPRSFHIVIG